MRLLAFASLILTALTATAQPVITSLTPTSGPATGGTAVTIKGSGFSTCIICSPALPPAVFFGGVPATSVRLIDANTLEAFTPQHFAGTFSVRVDQFNGGASVQKAFTFTGPEGDAFEAILLPVFSPVVRGAFGSEFHTIARAANKTGTIEIPVFGVSLNCVRLSPVEPEEDVTFIPSDQRDHELNSICSTSQGRFLYVQKARARDLTVNLRVRDESRSARSQGVEIPVVRSSEFRHERIALLGVSLDTRFRNTLRIYAPAGINDTVKVSFAGRTFDVPLQPGNNRFEPSFALLTNFPSAADLCAGQACATPVPATVVVTIEPPPIPGGVQPTPPGIPIWAFVSATNNETQEITTITPD
jgi:hypothetical protein